MDNHITCPHCKKEFAINEALMHQMQEEAGKKFEEERQKLRDEAKQWRDLETKKFEEKYAQTEKEIESQLKKKLQKEIELKFLDAKNENEEIKKEKQLLQEQVLETNKLLRQIKTEKDQMGMEMEKRLAAEEAKIREDAKKRADEENQFKMLEKDKKINDAMKMVEEYKRKLEQGSQQTQGEVLELQIEDMLKREFPLDEIKEVPKGRFGADLIQVVHTRSGEHCGTIIWELKRTKVWSSDWIPKLKNDQREIKAEVAVIISEVLPPEYTVFGHKDGVWVGNFHSVIGIATALRHSLLKVAAIQTASVGKKEKMEVLWDYLQSVEFTQKIEAILEAFSSMQKDIEDEKRWFNKKWAKQETSIRRVIDNTIGMRGGLESIMGKALPEMKNLDIGSEKVVETDSTLLKDESSSLF